MGVTMSRTGHRYVSLGVGEGKQTLVASPLPRPYPETLDAAFLGLDGIPPSFKSMDTQPLSSSVSLSCLSQGRPPLGLGCSLALGAHQTHQ